MRLPFTVDQFLDVFALYNDTMSAVALVLWLASAYAVTEYFRRTLTRRLMLGLLAVHWIWAGVVYHWAYFSAINPAAWLFGALFLLQGLLFARMAEVSDRGQVARITDARRLPALGLMLYALLYPAVVMLGDHSYPRMPTFGVPCPTTILTAGFLIGASPRLPRAVAAIPIAWTVVGGSGAFLLGVRADLMLFVAGAAMAATLVGIADK